MARDYSKNETYREFKARVIDPISDTYCAAKWYNATIWLAHGQTASCHHPPQHNIDINEIKINPSAIHNTQHKKLMRKLMLEGQRPPECEYCWKIEDMNRDALSDRVFKTQVHSDEAIEISSKLPWDSDVMPETLEIMFDPVCNFACSYCSSTLSTSWGRDLKQNGPYKNLISESAGAYIKINPWDASSNTNDENNPYIQAFWRWWESGLADNLEEIRVTGGEPLMASGVWKLFQWFKDNPERGKKIKFSVNSNLVPKPELMDKLIQLSYNIPHLKVYTSNESVGAHSEYIRDGMEYNTWWNNIERLHTESNVKSVSIMLTLNSLCLASFTEFMDDVLAFRRKHQTQTLSMANQVLRKPSFQSIAILPVEIKQFYKNKIQTWLNDRLAENETVGKNNVTILLQSEIERLKWLIDYLDIVETPHDNTADQDKLYSDFKNFYEQYDQRRNKNFRTTFPKIFVDFIDSIKTIKS